MDKKNSLSRILESVIVKMTYETLLVEFVLDRNQLEGNKYEIRAIYNF